LVVLEVEEQVVEALEVLEEALALELLMMEALEAGDLKLVLEAAAEAAADGVNQEE
jgi:hypothetical protein